jgi:hypothetical protein
VVIRSDGARWCVYCVYLEYDDSLIEVKMKIWDDNAHTAVVKYLSGHSLVEVKNKRLGSQ